MLTKELIGRLETKVLETYDKAQSVFGRVFDLPIIEFEDMGRVAGRAFYWKNLIKFSPTLFKENVEDFTKRTIVHECGHIIAHKVYPNLKRPHGPEWKKVMQMLGAQDIGRCHSYDTSSVVRKYHVRKFKYKCDCSVHWSGPKIHGKISRGATYTCNSCKSVLVLA